MAENNDKKNVSDKEAAKKVKSYEKVIEKLKNEREALVDEVNRDYKEARRYVRSHPEEGVLIGFVGGLALGVILGRLMK
ncbi:MAG: hypothetical protein U5J95_02460 [Balneolaceae bacterium]|nr:hypothetical protein [Balneolaceae bacterium]